MLIENVDPIVQQQGLKTNKAVDFSGASSLTLPSNAGLIATTAPVIASGLTASGSASNDFSGSTGTFKFPTGVTIGLKPQVLASSGNTTVTAAMTGSVMLFDGGSITYTLPTGVVGMVYTFLSSAVANTSQKIITTSGDFFTGTITVSTAAGTPATYMAVGNGTTHLAITQNGTTTGGGVGSVVTVVCYAANKWNAFGQVIGTGSNTTPFATS